MENYCRQTGNQIDRHKDRMTFNLHMCSEYVYVNTYSQTEPQDDLAI